MESNFQSGSLYFCYLNLQKYLYKLYKDDITDINILLLISLEQEYYEGKNLKKILTDLVKLSSNLICQFDILDEQGNPTGKKTEKIKFTVNKISLDVGDVLNRHRWIYRYNEEYMLEHNLSDEEEHLIPHDIKREIKDKAYERGKQQGFDWFREHAIDALNSFLPENKQIAKDFELTSGITNIFKGNENIPPIEYICYEHWLKHPKYKIVEKALNEIRNIEYSIIERIYKEEARYFLKRLTKRGEFQMFPNMFVKYSKNYLADETIKHILIQEKLDNNLELYYGQEVRHNVVFRSEKASKNEIIKNHLSGELAPMKKPRHITIFNG